MIPFDFKNGTIVHPTPLFAMRYLKDTDEGSIRVPALSIQHSAFSQERSSLMRSEGLERLVAGVLSAECLLTKQPGALEGSFSDGSYKKYVLDWVNCTPLLSAN